MFSTKATRTARIMITPKTAVILFNLLVQFEQYEYQTSKRMVSVKISNAIVNHDLRPRIVDFTPHNAQRNVSGI